MVSKKYSSSFKFAKKKRLVSVYSCKKKVEEWGWTWEKADQSYEDINKENVSHRNNPQIAAS
jgi:hypothetical protein